MKSIRSSIISLVHATVFFLHVGVSSLPAIFAQHGFKVQHTNPVLVLDQPYTICQTTVV
jgi:hypothetical protein